METRTPTYSIIYTAGDFGPWASKLVLTLPCEVGVNDLSPATFNVFGSRHESDGSVLIHTEWGSTIGLPSQDFVPVLAAYPCTETGAPTARSTYAALELPENPITKPIEITGLGHGYFAENRFRITQLHELPSEPAPVTGLVFDECSGTSCPDLAGWQEGRMSEPVDGFQLSYGYYTPSFDPIPQLIGPAREVPQKAALIVWLHGASEGGTEPLITYTSNRVSAISQPHIQDFFGGAAWVLTPQTPTYWIDNGKEVMGTSNETIYSAALKACIDEFVAEHADHIDTGRIIVGGLSNGGFMTVRMCLDYPGFFAAAIPCCAPFYVDGQTPEVVEALAQTPTWFVHSKGDELIDPSITSVPLYHKLKAAGGEVHMSYFDHVEDLTGVYRDAQGRPLRSGNHGVWIHVYNDFCRTDLDGGNVLVDGEPVGLWEWAGKQRK